MNSEYSSVNKCSTKSNLLMGCAVWIENCKCDQLKSINNLAANTKYRICSLHFETDMFSNFQKNRLKPEAVPTLFDTMEVEFVDEPKNNDDPECSISDFIYSVVRRTRTDTHHT
ncbi:hypothetical protein QTP88_015185 [Uroleucon formosanum]